MKIVNLEAYPTNPGDLSWDPVRALGDMTIYEHAPADMKEVIRRCTDAEIVMLNKVPFTGELMKQLPKLRMIAVQATGYNVVDTAAAKERGIVVCNVPGYSTYSVAQLVFAFLMEFCIGAGLQTREAQAGKWSASPDFVYYARPIYELAGKTLGIFGFGTIGQTVAHIGAALGMKILYYSRTKKNVDFAQYVSLDELFSQSDVLTLHAPMTPETAKIINAENLAKMKKSAYLINTARGGLVDSEALADALNNGRLAGAGVDVLEQEPPPADHPLLHSKNTLITPHVGWASADARQRLINILAENIRNFQEGHPINVVNP